MDAWRAAEGERQSKMSFGAKWDVGLILFSHLRQKGAGWGGRRVRCASEWV